MAGTTGLEPATSAVTAKRNVVTYRKQASRMASFGAVRNDQEPLSNPYQTHDLCSVNLCPNLCPNLCLEPSKIKTGGQSWDVKLSERDY